MIFFNLARHSTGPRRSLFRGHFSCDEYECLKTSSEVVEVV